MAEFRFTNIDPRDIPRSVAKINFVASDLAINQLKSAIAFRGQRGFDTDDYDAVSYLGTAVFDTFTFGNITDRSQNAYINILGERTEFDPIVIYQAILTVTRTKNIVNTQPNGKNGTIKQYISAGDYLITLQGRVSGVYDNETAEWNYSSRKFPQEGASIIKNICDVNANIEVSSNFLQLFGITKVVITDQNLYQREGIRNEQMFEINMLSDEDVILEFTEEDVEDTEFLKSILGL